MIWSVHTCSAVTNAHSSATLCCSTPTPLLLPSPSSITGSFHHSSSHRVNRVTPSDLYSAFRAECLRKAKPPALQRKPKSAEHTHDFATRQQGPAAAGTAGILPDRRAYAVIHLQTTLLWSLFLSILYLICYIINTSVQRKTLTCAALLWLSQINARHISEARRSRQETSKDLGGNSPWALKVQGTSTPYTRKAL